MKDVSELAREIFQMDLKALTDRERCILERFVSRQKISRNINLQAEEESSFGERLADKVASFGGSWTFIGLFSVVLILWIVGNTVLLSLRGTSFDPYPFIFLNLILSMLAAIQAPVIMMSQNRQADKDRIAAAHDYEVNLKAELEIMQLHNKLDDMRQNQLTELLTQQSKHIELLEQLLAAQSPPANPA